MFSQPHITHYYLVLNEGEARRLRVRNFAFELNKCRMEIPSRWQELPRYLCALHVTTNYVHFFIFLPRSIEHFP